MAKQNWLKTQLALFKDDFDFRLETVILNLTERICGKMKQKSINRTELAGLLNVSPPAVTKILNGNSNFTLKTLLSLSDALGQNLEINFIDKEIASTYLYPVDTKTWNITTHVDDKYVNVCDNLTISGSADTVIDISRYDETVDISETA
jgi:transcriptional regulator with XRE-family HTH domain